MIANTDKKNPTVSARVAKFDIQNGIFTDETPPPVWLTELADDRAEDSMDRADSVVAEAPLIALAFSDGCVTVDKDFE